MNTIIFNRIFRVKDNNVEENYVTVTKIFQLNLEVELCHSFSYHSLKNWDLMEITSEKMLEVK